MRAEYTVPENYTFTLNRPSIESEWIKTVWVSEKQMGEFMRPTQLVLVTPNDKELNQFADALIDLYPKETTEEKLGRILLPFQAEKIKKAASLGMTIEIKRRE
jgi:hypothetical protein